MDSGSDARSEVDEPTVALGAAIQVSRPVTGFLAVSVPVGVIVCHHRADAIRHRVHRGQYFPRRADAGFHRGPGLGMTPVAGHPEHR
jgi:hypothetical protein